MSSSALLRYDIFITGRILDGAPVDEALAGLAQILQLSEAQVTATFRNAPVRVKHNVDAETASRIQTALEHLHIETHLRPLPRPASEDATLEIVGLNEVTGLAENSGCTDDELAFQIDGNPDHGILTVKIPADGAVYADCSAVVFLDPNIKMSRPDKNSDLGSHHYINRFCSEHTSGDLGLAAKLPGEVRRLPLDRPIRFRMSAYLASSREVRFPPTDSDAAFSSEVRDKFLSCEGPGAIWLSGCGGIIQVTLRRPLHCRVDRILAWQGDINFTASLDDVTLATGSGTLWLQTLSEKSLGIWADSLNPI